MEEPLSWVWLLQAALLILFTGLVAALLLVLHQRRRPTYHHVTTLVTNQTWDDVKAQIEERSPTPVRWQYTEVAKERGFHD